MNRKIYTDMCTHMCIDMRIDMFFDQVEREGRMIAAEQHQRMTGDAIFLADIM